MSIAVLVPTRGRLEQFRRMYESIGRTAYSLHNVNVYSGSNGSDIYADRQYPIDCPTVFMWNDLAARAMHPSNKLFMLGADDTVFATPGWDKALLDHYNALHNKIHVYALQDSRDATGTPHPIFTRQWIEKMGWMIPPIFTHWMCDTWSVEIAKYNNCFTHMKDYLLVHDKCHDHGKPDETHLGIRRRGLLSRDTEVAKSCAYYLEYEKQRLATIMGEV